MARQTLRDWVHRHNAEGLAGLFDSYTDIVDTCCTAWNFFANDTAAVASITARSWATVNL